MVFSHIILLTRKLLLSFTLAAQEFQIKKTIDISEPRSYLLFKNCFKWYLQSVLIRFLERKGNKSFKSVADISDATLLNKQTQNACR